MNTKKNIIEIAKDSFENQGKSILSLGQYLTKDFEDTVNTIHSSSGRVIVSGIGKSAIIGMKIVATLNSTGTPAIFMHAAEAIHGDLGVVQNNDTVILISKSGNTPEIKNLVPFLKERSICLVSITSNSSSFLAKNSNFFLSCYIEKEACLNNLAPTTSTTAQLVIGDALAICLSNLNGFSPNDFAKHHPGGMLGKKLFLKVSEIIDKNLKPELSENDDFKTVIDVISKNLLGAAVVTLNKKAIGIITDGDIRRVFSKNHNIEHFNAKNLMSLNPQKISSDTLASKALEIMNEHKITQLVVEDDNKYMGLIHMHNIINEGLSLMDKNVKEEMSFLDHLEDLRWHLIRSVFAVLITGSIAFIAKDFIFDQVLFGPKKIDFFTYEVLCNISNFLGFDDSFCINEMPFRIQSRTMSGQFSAHIWMSITAGFHTFFSLRNLSILELY